jgi:hypothetical protein
MTNLRQQIEEIVLCSPCNCSPKGQECDLWAKCTYDCERVDRICEAIKAKVEGMKQCKLEEHDTLDVNINNATAVQWESDKSYLLKELEAAKKYHGEFACLNMLEGLDGH